MNPGPAISIRSSRRSRRSSSMSASPPGRGGEADRFGVHHRDIGSTSLRAHGARGASRSTSSGLTGQAEAGDPTVPLRQAGHGSAVVAPRIGRSKTRWTAKWSSDGGVTQCSGRSHALVAQLGLRSRAPGLEFLPSSRPKYVVTSRNVLLWLYIPSAADASVTSRYLGMPLDTHQLKVSLEGFGKAARVDDLKFPLTAQ